MKKNEIIELDGKEYTLELNRDSFLKIDQYANIEKSREIITRRLYDYIDIISENEDPFADTISDEEFDKAIEEKEQTLKKLVTRSFWIWLYPNHKMTYSQVEQIIGKEFEDDEKGNDLVNKYSKYLAECIEIRTSYEEERKNLKAQANK